MNFKSNLTITLSLLAVMWLVYILNLVLPFDLRLLGIRPRSLSGLPGILLSPFLHGGLFHLLANTIPFFVLMMLALTYDRTLALEALVIIAVGGGLLVWLFGASRSVHIGASGLIFGLIGFLLFVGVFRRDIKAILISLLVLFFYGGVLLWGFIPRSGVSWIGHFFGFVAGILTAWLSKSAVSRV